jgi:hypothetical protein
LKSNHLLVGRHLDYGCGRGDDADELGCERYDPHFSPVMPDGQFETITVNYVLNVIEEPEARMQVLRDVQSRLRPGSGRAYIAVRANKKDLKGLTSIGTWQGLITLDLPIVYKDSDSVIYELRPGHVGYTCRAETFGGDDVKG